MRRWQPLRAHPCYTRPPVGALIALRHAVWRVAAVAELPRDAQENLAWLSSQRGDVWPYNPYEVTLAHLAGALPPHAEAAGWDRTAVAVCRPLRAATTWHVYATSRWPMCSCCGEPMPCQAEMQEQEIAASMAVVEKRVSRRDGDCWACGQIVTHRQKRVAYPGDNVDLPGGIMPVFHLRKTCWWEATSYERRWLAADPARPRVLTWPDCGGRLVVHWDGSSECERSGCQGHLSHDHHSLVACYMAHMNGCPRRCPRQGHPGTTHAPRPARVPGG